MGNVSNCVSQSEMSRSYQLEHIELNTAVSMEELKLKVLKPYHLIYLKETSLLLLSSSESTVDMM